MKHNNLIRLLIGLCLISGFAFGVINYGGSDYTEALLPVTLTGSTTIRNVVIGTGVTVTFNTAPARNNCTSFTINGNDYYSTQGQVTLAGDDRYFIEFVGKGNGSANITITGTDDWTTQTYTAQTAPFSQSGSGSHFYSTTDPVDSVITSNMDFFLINNADYSNSTVTTLPSKINGTYYFYYGTTNASGSLEVTKYTPKLNVSVFMEGGL